MEPLYLFVKSLKYLNQLARFRQISTSFRPKHVAVIENEIPAEELCQTASLCVTWLMKTDLTDVFCKKAQLVQTNLYYWFGHFKDVHISIIGSPVHISLLTAMCQTHIHTHTHTHLMALCPDLPRLAGTTKVKPIWILLKQETVSGSGISWAIIMQVCTSLQTDNQASIPPLSFLQTGCTYWCPTNRVKARSKHRWNITYIYELLWKIITEEVNLCAALCFLDFFADWQAFAAISFLSCLQPLFPISKLPTFVKQQSVITFSIIA